MQMIAVSTSGVGGGVGAHGSPPITGIGDPAVLKVDGNRKDRGDGALDDKVDGHRKDRRNGALDSPPVITIEASAVQMNPEPGGNANGTAKMDIAVQELPRPPEETLTGATKSPQGLADGTDVISDDGAKGLFEDIAPDTLPRPPEVPLMVATMSPQEPADDAVGVSDKGAEGVVEAITPDTLPRPPDCDQDLGSLRADALDGMKLIFGCLSPDATPPDVKAAFGEAFGREAMIDCFGREAAEGLGLL